MPLTVGKVATFAVLVGAAILEVGGDALIRKGMRGGGFPPMALGFVVLSGYGVVVNLGAVDFSRLLGAYVGVFAIASVLAGVLVFHDRIAPSTWVGVGVILAGSLIVHLGRH
jgi:small multidrug resistance family-3 protein